MALTGANGDNETHIGSSKSISFSLYNASSNEIQVANLANPLDFWIPHEATQVPFQYISATNASTSLNSSGTYQLIDGFIVSGFNLSGSNVSVHIQISPVNTALPYVALVKFGENPIFRPDITLYDMMSVYCPSDLLYEENASFYLMFANMSLVNGFRGYVGFSVFELNATLVDCSNKSANSIDTLKSKLIQSKCCFEKSLQNKQIILFADYLRKIIMQTYFNIL